MVFFSDGNILSYGSEDLVICPNYEYDTVIDCKGGTILPGECAHESVRKLSDIYEKFKCSK